ncbi:hypothetical protein [Hyphomonas pacifica]|jgi:hypothetical protein|uniref:Uncharacterized protein n=1 Tax=Hyphomonas pacifica TaxID=1280941 RepID=A0A062TW48_9PROT|nr:hypothetical protein [Hyphomonas pacifica]KCZ50257.1 hypothetical protein HY2_14665 [Hyphomonas pacifica]RAN32516.1 hypothetical protein HY3_15120 [Hyphomonas pacifica]RAN36797.1 hypothetical protein HY11_11175 [Hyphomonas pacifica]
MKYLLTGVAAIAMLTACGDKDKPVKEAGAEYASSAGTDVKLRKGDPATAGQVLSVLSLDSSESGRIAFGSSKLDGAKAVFTDVTLKAAESDDEDALDGTDVKAGKLEFEGLGMIDGKANFSRMVMSDITMTAADPEESADGSGAIKSIELVNPSPEVAAWVASLFGEGEPIDMPEGDALSFDLWSMNGLDFKVDDEDGSKGNFLINNVSVTGLKDQKAAQMLLKDMTFDMYDPSEDMDMKANIGNIDIRGFDWGMFMPEEGEKLEDSFESGFMAGLNPKDPANPGYDSIDIKDFDVDMSGVTFDMPKMVSKVSKDKKGRAVKVTTEPVKMTLTAGEGKLGEQLGAQLAMLGYEKLELTMAGEQTYDPDADIVTLAKGKNYWELKDGFRLDFGAKYAGAAGMAESQAAEMDSGTQDPSAMFDAMMEKLTIHSFEMALDDDGIVDRAFNAYAAQSGEDPQQVRNQMAGMMAMLPMMASGSGIDMELATEASTALSSFITDPKTLTISLKPKTPLKVSTLAEMEDPSALTKESLGFSATNK